MAEKMVEGDKGLLAKICGGIKKYKKEILIGAVASAVLSLIPYYCHLSNLYRSRIKILDQQIELLKVNKAEQEPNALIAETRGLLLKAFETSKSNNEKYLSIIEKSGELMKFAEILEYNLKVANDFSTASKIKLLKDSPDYKLVFFKPSFKEASENLESLLVKTDKYSIKEIKDRINKKEPWGIYGDFNDDNLKDIVMHDYAKKKIVIRYKDANSEEYAVTDSTFSIETILVRYGLPDGSFGFWEKMPDEIYNSFWKNKIFREKDSLEY